ncbi:BQ2448_250 [Microbotryum intermedium]|uniref:BQ2448_250 protein n=1 Tax=Microbotryum intermedium TaxID=269621 RepID=A0A238F5V1_9BASI|nr:BQ2448_250 [Microbotryum intermedium]
MRIQNQFISLPLESSSGSINPIEDNEHDVLFAIGTVLRSANDRGSDSFGDHDHLKERLIEETYASLKRGSLAHWKWIVAYPTRTEDSKETKEALISLDLVVHELRQLDDPRIILAPYSESTNLHATMQSVLDKMIHARAQFGLFLDGERGVMLEPTWLEKVAWCLHSVGNWSLVAGFQKGQEDLAEGLHLGARNLKTNGIPDTTAFKLDVVEAIDCGFAQHQRGSNPSDERHGRDYLSSKDEVVSDDVFGGFWWCLASKGQWGGTIAEVSSWPPFGSPLPSPSTSWSRAMLETRYPTLTAATFPQVPVARFVPLEHMSWIPAFSNVLLEESGKSVMIIQGWLLVGGSELGMLEITRHLAERGYRVTMVLTRLKYPISLALLDQISQYTEDVHCLPAFLRLSDFPRYIKYLIDSRGIEVVLMSNSQLIYEILPAMVEVTPHVAWIDYLHNEAYDGWKTDGFPSYSLINQRYLSRTLTCSEYLRDWLIARGYPAERVGVAKLGINTARFVLTNESTKSTIRSEVLDVPPRTFVLSSSARLDTQKRPLLVPDVIALANARLASLRRLNTSTPPCEVETVRMYMMGDGHLRDSLRDRVQTLGLKSKVFLLGTVDDPATILRGSDAFFLPSATEGISLAVAEAMAMGLPVITSRAGGLPEQLGSTDSESMIARAGRLIPIQGVPVERQIEAYTEAILELACSTSKRRALGEEARRFVEHTFDQKDTLKVVEAEFARAQVTEMYDTRVYTVPMALEDHAFVDLSAVQKQLSQPKLTGAAGELQARCWLDTSDATAERWTQAVLGGVQCGRSMARGETNWLFKSAKEQCGAWCLWDLRSLDIEGWHFNGRCFKPFAPGDRSAQICAEWFDERPLVNFVDTSTAAPNKILVQGSQ